MGEKKLDRRIRYTIGVIKESMWELMEQEELQKITVKELCARADINRATFYAHYDSLDALLEEMEVERSRELFQSLSSLWVGENYYARVLEDIFRYFQQNPLMCELLLRRESRGQGLEIIMQQSMEESIRHWSSYGRITPQQAQWVYHFLLSGVKELLSLWYQSGFAMDEEALKEVIIGMTEQGLRGFVYGKQDL